MNSLPSLIIKRRNHNKRASLAMPVQSYSAMKSCPIVNDYFVKLYTSNHCSMFDEQINCINQRKEDHHQRYPRSVVITNTSSNFRSTSFRNNHHYQMKRYQHRGYTSNLLSSKQRTMMIDADQDGLMQSSDQLQKSTTTDSNFSQKKTFSSSRIRLALRSSCLLDDKQQQLFDELFSSTEQTTNISQCILDQCLERLTKTYSNTLLIISGCYREVHQIQTAILTSTITRLCNFIQENSEKDLVLRINIDEYLNEQTSNCILSSNDYTVTSSSETSHYLTNLCFNHRFNSLLITFTLEIRSLNTTYALLNILLTNDIDNESTKEQFSNLLMSLALSYSSNRQKQNLSRKRTLITTQSLSSLLTEYLGKHFVYLFGNIKNEKQLKYWLKIQRLLRTKRTSVKMSRDRYDSSPTTRNQEEIWIDGPLSSPKSKTKEIWIDGPQKILSYSPKKSLSKHRSSSHKSKPSVFSPTHPFFSSTTTHRDTSSSNFDTESIISSHCHVPALPVFQDHSLLPFRSNQTLPRNPSTKIDLRLSTNKLNDDMEMLEKTLENLLIPSPITPNDQTNLSQSMNRIDRLSSLMNNDEKTKRLSRIVSPTRFEKYSFPSADIHSPSAGSSVPNSPLIQSRTHRTRTPITSLPSEPSHRLLLPTIKKLKTNLENTPTHTRPSLFQRLFGLRPSSTTTNAPSMSIPIVIHTPPSSPLISPLTVTLDSHDDLMPLTTSSTTSSASGRASSSGYESMSNTILEDMITSVNNETNQIKLRNKSLRKDTNTLWNSPNLRDKSHRQQRISQLKHRQNELKLELAMTKTFLLMDKTKSSEPNESVNATINNNTPMHSLFPNINEEDDLEQEIEHLERRLAAAKSQLIYVTYQKNKQLKS